MAMTLSDEELALRAQRGSQEAFTMLVDRHQKRLYGLALQMLRHPDDAADAAQEAFLRSYAALHTYDSNYSFGAWLYRIAYNYCMDVLRRRQRTPVVRGAAASIEFALDNAVDPGPAVEEMAERNLSMEAIAEAVNYLPDDARHVLTLRYTSNLSYGEIAQVLSVPESTVTMRLHHAKRALRAIMNQSNMEPYGPS